MAQFGERAQGRINPVLLVVSWVVLFGGSYGLYVSGGPFPAREMFHEGGWGMWLIMAVFCLTLLIAIDSVTYLMRVTIDARSFMLQLGGVIQSGNLAGAVQLCESTNKPLSRIIGAGLARGNLGKQQVLAAMDEEAYSELPKIEKRTGYLAMMGNVATLTGLFGTIIGLIKSFAGVSKEAAADKATLLAAGISEAMNCTAFGLLTGISALLAYSVLNGKTQAMLDELNYFTHKGYRMWRAVAQRGQDDFHRHPIKPPGPHLTHNIGLGKGHGGKGGHGKKKSTFASLQLTPMIDMFIVVLIFLLMTFSASGEILFVTKDIKLPFADKVEKLDRAPVIAVSYPENDPAGGVVTLDGSEVSTAKELKDDDNPDWKIAKLTEQLEVKKHNWKLTNPDKSFPGEVIVQADQNVDFKIIKKVMYSCGLAGYSNVHFAVTQKAKPEGGGGG
jgi:biopolymer transport protein ExbB/TolQ/biopolymer transport protein ExbD